MGIFTEVVQILLGVNEPESKAITDKWLPRLMKLGWHILRIAFVLIFIHCLWAYPSAGVLFVVLMWFIIEAEKRINHLEKELKIERKMNRDSYSTERYSPRSDYRRTNPGDLS